MGNSNSTFNYKEYLANYPDLVASGIDTHEKALEHWNTCGKAEGRTFNSFDWIQYLLNYPDLVPAGIDNQAKAVEHFYNYGQSEGRTSVSLNTIISRLLNFNIHNKKLHYNYPGTNSTNSTVTIVPPYGVLVEFRNGTISILKTNKGTLFPDGIYNERFIPFYNYLKKINTGNIALLCIFIYSDTIFKDDNTKIDAEYLDKIMKIDLPIFVSSIDKDLYGIGKNIFLIPNFYTYNNNIPLNEIIDIPFDFKINKAVGAFSNTCWNRLELKKWSIDKQNIEINITMAIGPVVPELMSSQTISIKEQLNYKYIISMDGCVTSWNGLLWKMYSNSLVIKEKTNCIEYWYFLLNDQNIIEFEINNMDIILNIINNNYKNDTMLKEQQELAKIITSDETTHTYLTSLFNLIKFEK